MSHSLSPDQPLLFYLDTAAVGSVRRADRCWVEGGGGGLLKALLEFTQLYYNFASSRSPRFTALSLLLQATPLLNIPIRRWYHFLL